MTTALSGRSNSLRYLVLGHAGLLALLLSGIACQAEQAISKPVAATQTPEERIEAALRDPTSIEFVETPLSDVVDYLKDRHQIEIQLDTKAMDAASIAIDTPVTRNLRSISLSAALRQVLGHLGLTYVVRDEVLLITTTDAAREMVDVRVYEVSDLAANDEAVALAGVVQRALTGAPLESSRNLTTTAQFSGNSAPGGAATAGGSRPTVNQDLNIVSIEPFRDTLVVRANYHGHNATAGLLAELRSKVSKAQAMPAAKPVSPAATTGPTR